MFHEKTSCPDLEQFRPASNVIKLHIYHAYLQAYIWHHEAIESATDTDSERYGFTCDEGEDLVSIINHVSQLPADFPFSCKCTKCELKELACCQ